MAAAFSLNQTLRFQRVEKSSLIPTCEQKKRTFCPETVQRSGLNAADPLIITVYDADDNGRNHNATRLMHTDSLEVVLLWIPEKGETLVT